MKNILILGSGRSGTSMMAGLFSKSGYHMGEDLYKPRNTNPKGFFESREINFINEDIIKLSLPQRIKIWKWELLKHRPTTGQRWLAQMPLKTELKYTQDIVKRIKTEVAKAPFCYKDPRFSYTLPLWKPYLKDTILLVVFRHPASTVVSILKECQGMPYLSNLKITEEDALNVWYLMYSHILSFYNQQKWGKWYFFHYEQVLSGEATTKIKQDLDITVDEAFVEASLQRNKLEHSNIDTDHIREVYLKLCEYSNYTCEYELV